jgi:hypothetical protein
MTEESGFNFQQGKEIFLFFIACRLTLGPTQPLIPWIPGAGVKYQGCEADHSPPSDAEVKNMEFYLHSPICLLGMLLN